jgi:diadenylate cyclase
VPDVVRDVFERIDAVAVLDILLISLAIYWLLLLLRGTTAWTVLRGVSLLLVGAFLLARFFDLQVVNWMLENMVTGLVIGVIVVFQPEIRRVLDRLGRTGWQLALVRQDQEGTIDVAVRAAARLARQRHGALVVFERETGLQEVIDTGVELNAELSAELLGSIFMPNTPLHDGAVIVRGDQVIAAGCTLPLTDSPLQADLGMRHRAAVGMTEGTDAIVIVVSEERGTLGLAAQGRMRANLDETETRTRLRRMFALGDGLRDSEPGVVAAGAEARPEQQAP